MSEYNYELIDGYVSGEMSAADKTAFEKQMQDDPLLANEVALYRTIETEMKTATRDEKDLREKIATLNKRYFKKEIPVKKIKTGWWLAGAAAVAAALILILVNPFGAGHKDPDKLFAYYSSTVNELNPGQRGNNDSILTQAAKRYNAKDYAGALPLFDTLINHYPGDNELILSKAICLLKTGDEKKAEVLFNILSSGETVYRNEATWFLALTKLKQKDMGGCKATLEKIPAGSDRYAPARKLLDELPGR